mmetsp:Transcript_8961/g.36981  ORF Transcript_8961/g.36981 Transcript_8961/m.36981 type:complete len:253 (-) Transcript_8961:334-1092(-)
MPTPGDIPAPVQLHGFGIGCGGAQRRSDGRRQAREGGVVGRARGGDQQGVATPLPRGECHGPARGLRVCTTAEPYDVEQGDPLDSCNRPLRQGCKQRAGRARMGGSHSARRLCDRGRNAGGVYARVYARSGGAAGASAAEFLRRLLEHSRDGCGGRGGAGARRHCLHLPPAGGAHGRHLLHRPARPAVLPDPRAQRRQWRPDSAGRRLPRGRPPRQGGACRLALPLQRAAALPVLRGGRLPPQQRPRLPHCV